MLRLTDLISISHEHPKKIMVFVGDQSKKVIKYWTERSNMKKSLKIAKG